MKLCGRDIGIDQPLFLIAGPDTLESLDLALEVASTIKAITDRLGILYVFKGSFDKANRSSGKSYRGPGLAEGLKIMETVKAQARMIMAPNTKRNPRSREYAPLAFSLVSGSWR